MTERRFKAVMRYNEMWPGTWSKVSALQRPDSITTLESARPTRYRDALWNDLAVKKMPGENMQHVRLYETRCNKETVMPHLYKGPSGATLAERICDARSQFPYMYPWNQNMLGRVMTPQDFVEFATFKE